MKSFTFILVLTVLFFSGCSSKQYFEPENTHDYKVLSSELESPIVYSAADGVTLENNKFISKDGISKIALEKNYTFLNSNDGIVIATDNNGSLYINNDNKIEYHKFDKNIVSASISKDMIALSFVDNSISIYNIKTKETSFKEYYKSSILNDLRIANPIFLDSVILYPTLDGKIIVIDINKKTVVKIINIDPESKINNIIFLNTVGDTLVAATPTKVFTFIDGITNVKSMNVKNVVVNNTNVYVSTLEGDIVKYDLSLNKIKSKKYKYAKFHALGYDKKLYALESQGFIIEINDDFSQEKIYDFSFDEDEKVVIIGNKLYYEDKYILLK